jgi:hypothetical protein
MRMLVVSCILTAAWFNLPTSAHARIALNRARIVSISALKFSDLKPGMAIEIVIAGRGGTDQAWEVRSIRLVAPVDMLGP